MKALALSRWLRWSRRSLRQFNLEPIGTTASVTAQFYAITAERRLHHPAVALLTENAKNRLFPLQTPAQIRLGLTSST